MSTTHVQNLWPVPGWSPCVSPFAGGQARCPRGAWVLPSPAALGPLRPLTLPPTGPVDLGLLRRQQLKLYVLKAGRALLPHQDQLRQTLAQPAVQEAAAQAGR